jgi:YfiH family protein
MSRTLFTSRSGGDLKALSVREQLQSQLSFEHLIFMEQTHSDLVEIADGSLQIISADALVTTARGVALAAMAADCMPITFVSDSVVGVAHVGRVGLLKGIAGKTIERMRELGAQEISATIGPSICGNCYEVSPEMYEEVINLLPATRTDSLRHCLDLQSGVRSEFEALGVRVRNLKICTLENPYYFSYRGGDQSARQAGIVSL